VGCIVVRGSTGRIRLTINDDNHYERCGYWPMETVEDQRLEVAISAMKCRWVKVLALSCRQNAAEVVGDILMP